MQHCVPILRTRIFTIAIMVLCFIAVSWYGIVHSKPAVSSSGGEPVLITVKAGMSAQQIGNILKQSGIIDNVTFFRIVAKLDGMENSLQAGDYFFTQGMQSRQVVLMLSQGETAYYQLTVPEGYTIDQISKLLEEKQLGSAVRFKSAAQKTRAYDIISDGKTVYSAEGYAFPNTYRFSGGMTEEQLLSMMVSEFNRQLTAEMRDRAHSLGLSIRDLVILASLVEKEAQLERDRPIIAAVFLNRLKKEMPLQSCATIQYILGYPKPELSVQDTMISSPYNTYQNMGLPPGPIANPGIAAIKAVLYPADTDYLYFVADKQGAHHFSRTYEEHLDAINQVEN